MTLVPATGVVRTIAKAAAVDPEGTDELVRLALYETLQDFVELDRAAIDRAVEKSMLERSGEVRRALVRTYVSKRIAGEEVDDLLTYAEQTATVNKAIFRRRQNKEWDETKVKRDTRGRFAAELGAADPQEPEPAYQRAAQAIENFRSAGLLHRGSEVKFHGYVSDGENAVYPNVTNASGNATPGPPTKAAHPFIDQGSHAQNLQSLRSNEFKNIPERLTVDPKGSDFDPNNRRGQLLDATAAVTGGYGNATGVLRNAPIEDDQAQRALERWTQDSGSSRAFNRIGMIGSVLQDQGSGGIGSVGGVARVVGELGPQAEKVIGDNVRRTAYRYRGTERRPDAELVKDVAEVDQMIVGPPEAESIIRDPRNADPAQRVGAYYSSRARASARGVDPETDALELRLRGDTAAAYYATKLPNPKLATISNKAGRIPPSQGVIIDQHGNLTTQAQGYASDHYLPFDLKNLKRLKGGQYVRTRVGGGPTTEDVYTGLLSGARQIQVISNSGLFTVEFDPDTRGGRRYSDKARDMIGRYEDILHTLADKNSGLYEHDIPKQRENQIRQEAYEAVGWDQGAFQDEFDRRRNQERLKLEVKARPAEETEAARERIRQGILRDPNWANRTTSEVGREVDDRYQEEQDQSRDKPIQRLTLDGTGYHRALQALQQEFPYYIRSVDYQPIRQFREEAGIQRPRGGPTSDSPNFPDPNAQPPGGRIPDTQSVARPRQATSGGGESSAPPTTTTPTPPRTPTGGGGAAGAGLALPGNLPLAIPEHAGPSISALSSRLPQMTDRAGTALMDIEPAIRDTAAGGGIGEDPKELAAARNVDVKEMDPKEFADQTLFRLLAIQAGSIRQIPSYIATGTKKNAEGKEVPAVDDEVAGKFLQGLHNIKRQESARPLTPGGPSLVLPDAFDNAIKQMSAVVALRKPFHDGPVDDPALYKPDPDAGLPLRFESIDKLGGKQEAYEKALDQWTNSDNELGTETVGEVVAMESMDSASQRRRVRDAVVRYQSIVDWGKRGAPVDDRGSAPSDVEPDEARSIAAQEGQRVMNPRKRRLAAMQLAWSFLHARDIAAAVSGESVPKAQSPGRIGTRAQGPPPSGALGQRRPALQTGSDEDFAGRPSPEPPDEEVSMRDTSIRKVNPLRGQALTFAKQLLAQYIQDSEKEG